MAFKERYRVMGCHGDNKLLIGSDVIEMPAIKFASDRIDADAALDAAVSFQNKPRCWFWKQ